MHIAGEPVELGHRDRATQRARLGERGPHLRPTVERVASFAGLDLDELRRDVEPGVLSEPDQRLTLRFNAGPERPCRLVLTLI